MAESSRRRLLATYPAEYLVCRDLTHSWRPYAVENEDGGLWRQVVICASCGQLKDRLIRRRTGAVIRNWAIRYVKGYQIAGGLLDADERNEIRRLAISQVSS